MTIKKTPKTRFTEQRGVRDPDTQCSPMQRPNTKSISPTKNQTLVNIRPGVLVFCSAVLYDLFLGKLGDVNMAALIGRVTQLF